MAEPVVQYQDRLWSQECEAIDTEPEDTTEYVFANGRRFKRAAD